MSGRTVGSWEKGTQLPSAKALHILATDYGFSPTWLLTGEGPMMTADVQAPDPAPEVATLQADNAELTKEIRELSREIRELSRENRELRGQGAAATGDDYRDRYEQAMKMVHDLTRQIEAGQGETIPETLERYGDAFDRAVEDVKAEKARKKGKKTGSG